MRIHVTSRRARLSPAVRTYLEERLARIEKFAPVSEAHVILDAQKNRHVTEIVLHVKGKEMIAREESHDALASIDAAVGRLERQVKRTKDRQKTKVMHDGTRPNGDEKQGAVRSAARAMLASGRDAQKRADDEAAALRPRIVPARGLPGKPVTIDEAADELMANGLEFLAFLNAVTDQLNVLYKRKDGDLGLIAPRTARRPARA
ncbi:MAG: ribosome-associated translation inhibitor RaiA [Candidatus Eisenbacteria bacterium]